MPSNVELLRDWIDPAFPVYVLVDPLAGEPVQGIAASNEDATLQREQAWERQVIPVPLARSIALPPHQHPYLVGLRGADDPLLELTVGLAEEERLGAQSGGFDGEGRAPHTIGGWLQSGMRDSELADALSRMLRVNTDAPTRATYLRLADRRVLDLLCNVAGEERVASQLGRIRSWSYLDPLGALRGLRSLSEEGQALRLSVREWQRMERGERLHRTVSTCLGAQAAEGQPAGRFGYDIVEAAVLTAEEAARKWPHRFRSSYDEVTWAALAMFYPSLPGLAAVHALMADEGSPDEPAEPVRYLHGELSALGEQVQSNASTIR